MEKNQSLGKFILKLVGLSALMMVFWIIIFDVQRILFSIHNFSKFTDHGILNWLGAFVYSLRLDLASAGFLSLLPLIFLFIAKVWNLKWSRIAFFTVIVFELVIVAFIHAGEINAYPEWNHKLTGRVFMHLLNPDEVVRTADYGMMFFFVLYAAIEIFVGIKLAKWFFKFKDASSKNPLWHKLLVTAVILPCMLFLSLLAARGGIQQIPINTDAAYYSNHYVSNDLSVNSTYFFAKSFMLYNRTEIDQYIPEVEETAINNLEKELFDYKLEHDVNVLDNKRPNIVVLVMESWSGNAMGCMTDTETATPHFDALTKQGIFFNNVYGVSGTSEIGNAAIFSGYPGIPEVSITMQADKHRKIPCFNEDLKKWGYTSGYLFGGDLKYGNIGGYFKDHGFDAVEDEDDFPKNLPKGKLNYYDEDLYNLLIDKMNKLPQPFMQAGFTGSTHSPYDFPHQERFAKFNGVEGKFHNSLLYADSCLNDFFKKAAKQPWFDNTIFVIVADHGHATNLVQDPSSSAYNRIPVLFYGKPIKEAYRGTIITKLGSQIDIVRTLLKQMGGEYERYRWSKDLLNPQVPQYALHTINRGYGWVTPSGNFTYQMENKRLHVNNYSKENFSVEFNACQTLLAMIYGEYKQL